MQMRHIAFRRRGAAHCADDLSGRYLLARRHVRMRLQIGVGGLIAVVMGQHHSGSQQGILRHGLYRPAAGRQHCGAGVGGDIHPVVGAPIPQRLVIHQLLHGKGRQHLAAQRFHNEPRRFCRGRGGIGRRGFRSGFLHSRFRLQSLHRLLDRFFRHFHRLGNRDLRRDLRLSSRFLSAGEQQPAANAHNGKAHRQRAVKPNAGKHFPYISFHMHPPLQNQVRRKYGQEFFSLYFSPDIPGTFSRNP